MPSGGGGLWIPEVGECLESDDWTNANAGREYYRRTGKGNSRLPCEKFGSAIAALQNWEVSDASPKLRVSVSGFCRPVDVFSCPNPQREDSRYLCHRRRG